MNRLLRTCLAFCFLALVGLVLGATAQGEAQDGWGTVKGRIIWGGAKIPVQQPINLKGVDVKHCEEKGNILDEKWVVNKKNKGIRYTFIWLEPDPKAETKKIPIHPDLQAIKTKEVTVDQPVCKFVPHALALREGQDVVVKNSSPIAHNFKWTGDPFQPNTQGNVILPAKGTHTIKGLKASRFPILVNCNIHPWMQGYMRVFNHPYFAVTDADGAFELKNAPAGNFRLKIWHGSAGWRGGAAGRLGDPITIKAGKVNNLGDISFPPPP